MAPQPLASLQALLTALVAAKGNGTSIALNASTLAQTQALSLPVLFRNSLGIVSFTLDAAELPASVTGNTLTVGGTFQGLQVTLVFQDGGTGAIATQALFQAAQTAPLLVAFPILGASFFSGITQTGSAASVAVPGRPAPLSFATPTFSVVGYANSFSGFVVTSAVPRIDGVATGVGSNPIFVELPTPTSGWRVGPHAGPWSFTDFGDLFPTFAVLNVLPDIVPRQHLGLQSFAFNFYPYATSMSAVSVTLADTTGAPLWSACDNKVQFNTIVACVALDYSADALTLGTSGALDGNFTLGPMTLDAHIPFPVTGIWSITACPNITLDVLDSISSLFSGGANLDTLLPANLAGIGSFDLTLLSISVDATHFKLVGLSIGLASSAPWKLIPNVLELSSLQIRLTIDGTPAVSGSVIGQFALPSGSAITVQFGRTTPHLPWRLDVVSPAIALPSLSDLAKLTNNADLAGLVKAGRLDQLHFVMTDLNFGLTVEPFSISNLGLTLQLADANDPLIPTLDWVLIPGVLTLTRFAFGFQYSASATPPVKAFGSFALNDLQFDVIFAPAGASNPDALIAEYHAQGGAGTVDIKQLLKLISPSVAADLPDGIEIDLADALLAYLNTNGTPKYLFAMDISATLPLSELPFIGKALPADAVVSLKDLKVIVTSAALTADDVALINGLSPVPVLPSPQADSQGNVIPAGFSMMASLQLGELTLLMVSPPVPKQKSVGTDIALAAPPAAADSTMWIDVQKTFGPVSIQKVGFAYNNGALFAKANISLNAGGLEIDLLGIGIGTPIKQPSPRFTIDGLAVTFNEGPVSIMGGMIGTLDPLDFVGALSVRVPEFSLAAFAGYAEYQDHPSFFLYGVLDVPLGGPPPFFITGVAAGFGFNRSLVIPPVSGVATFPLVAWAVGGAGTPSFDPTKPIGDQVKKAITLLMNAGVVAPTVGEYWFAAGVRFTSFEIIDSFALLTLSFGPVVEIAVLGLSTLTIPPDDPKPVAEVQIALEVSFSPTTGLLAVAGQLTPNSYVLSKSCRLTGGFAFYLWFSGDLAGQTVLSLGGYNPNFTVPKYFPVVPRLGLTWQVIPELNITGGLYFAITPNVVMAGGMLSAVWHSGPIRAWFSYWADFLMQFSPFHYYVDGGIDLGASFTVDLWLFSISVTIHVGVTVALFGPPFAGTATVDLSIISFTIHFGNQDAPAPKTSIPWSDFVMQLLPSGRAQQKQRALPRGRLLLADAAAPAPAPSPPPACTQINVTTGLTRTLPANANVPVYLVNGTTFQCTVLTVIPNKTVTFDPNPSNPQDQNIQYAPDGQQPNVKGVPIQPNTDFAAGPADISAADFQPTLELSLTTTNTDSVLLAIRRLTNAPKAFWETKAFDANGVPKTDPSTVLTESTIPNALVGFTLIPQVTQKDYTRPVPMDTLLFGLDDFEPFAWSPGVPPTTDSFTDQTVADTIMSSNVVTMRLALLGALAAQGVTVDQTVNVQSLQDAANNDLDAAPRLQLLGEQAA
jgi:hypothetical protein